MWKGAGYQWKRISIARAGTVESLAVSEPGCFPADMGNGKHDQGLGWLGHQPFTGGSRRQSQRGGGSSGKEKVWGSWRLWHQGAKISGEVEESNIKGRGVGGCIRPPLVLQRVQGFPEA